MNYISVIFLILNSLFQSQAPTYETYASTLQVGQALEFEGKSVRFKEVITDSRCPKGVTCIWAGEAKVLVEFLEEGKVCGEQELTIGGGAEAVSLQQLFPGEEISVLPAVLAPYPDIHKEIARKEYKLSLQVRVRKYS